MWILSSSKLVLNYTFVMGREASTIAEKLFVWEKRGTLYPRDTLYLSRESARVLCMFARYIIVTAMFSEMGRDNDRQVNDHTGHLNSRNLSSPCRNLCSTIPMSDRDNINRP